MLFTPFVDADSFNNKSFMETARKTFPCYKTSLFSLRNYTGKVNRKLSLELNVTPRSLTSSVSVNVVPASEKLKFRLFNLFDRIIQLHFSAETGSC